MISFEFILENLHEDTRIRKRSRFAAEGSHAGTIFMCARARPIIEDRHASQSADLSCDSRLLGWTRETDTIRSRRWLDFALENFAPLAVSIRGRVD